ncbi:hypothetical protein Q1695_002559 [Nippostrongylus brasiliensis]|nr:hypothetical protein Q1695_002559 [Nippostrongylus brasiliensis]
MASVTRSAFLIAVLIVISIRAQTTLKELEFSCAAAPSTIWKPSLIFYVVPLFLLVLVMNKTISGNIHMIYDP